MASAAESAHRPYSDASPSARLSVILARQSDVAVVFRRGPTRLTQLIRWHRNDDRFFPGQWLRGRIYERRCDLSPSGEKLIYFAARYRQPLYAWTAISLPPFLSALALWPKGDCWCGGGQFEKEGRAQLNHPPMQMSLAEGFVLPKGMTLLPFGPHSGGGEDDPILGARLIRDGWVQVEPGQVHRRGLRAAVRITLDPPETWSKSHPAVPTLELRTAITGYDRRGGAWRTMQAVIRRRESRPCRWASSTGPTGIATATCCLPATASCSAPACTKETSPLPPACWIPDPCATGNAHPATKPAPGICRWRSTDRVRQPDYDRPSTLATRATTKSRKARHFAGKWCREG